MQKENFFAAAWAPAPRLKASPRAPTCREWPSRRRRWTSGTTASDGMTRKRKTLRKRTQRSKRTQRRKRTRRRTIAGSTATREAATAATDRRASRRCWFIALFFILTFGGYALYYVVASMLGYQPAPMRDWGKTGGVVVLVLLVLTTCTIVSGYAWRWMEKHWK
ncbi:MAG: hypothetical protein JOZ72_05410 [Alphaproteobacteria bacterium]|nr:hypothetical protein [Alphaproteobacteria bacterium]